MNFKRKRPKNRRAGCLMCKYYKGNGFGKNRSDSYRIGTVKKLIKAKNDIKESLVSY